MRIKECVLKRLGADTWLHHTASGYKVRMNDEGLAALRAMASRLSAAEMTADERYVYERLEKKGITGPDTGRPEDRRLHEKASSRLETLELEFSGRCNLRCAHCFSAMSGLDMDRPTLEKVFEGIDALEPVNLVVNGGEPLLNPLLPEALAGARSRHMRSVLTTNGTLATPEKAAILKESGLAKAVVSLDFFEDTHDALRGAGAFAAAVAGIRALVSAGVPVFVTAMVQEKSLPRLDEFRRFCMEGLGASGIRLSSVMPIGRAAGAPGLGLEGAKVKELFGKGEISAADGGDGTFSKLAGERTFICGAGISECFVSADGKVYACHYYQNLGESMGDLAAGSLEKIYRAYPGSGAAAVDYDWDKLGKCRACRNFASCRGGCRARARLLAGGWYDPDPYSCSMYGAC